MSMRRMAGLLVASALAATAVAGCSDDDDDLPTDSATGLSAALARVPAPEDDGIRLYYQNSRALNELLDGDFSMAPETPNYALLNGIGIPALQIDTIKKDIGVDVPASDLAITVGEPRAQYSLIAGGQDGGTITDKLSGAGWTEDGDRLVAPEPTAAEQQVAVYTLAFGQVRPDGENLLYGSPEADLSLIDGSGDRLADDEQVAAVAACLGDDVLTAIIDTPKLRETTPMVGLGVRAESADDRPEAVVCTSWESEDLAAAYAERAETALTEGASLRSAQPFSEIYMEPSPVEVDGTLASWRAHTELSNGVFKGFLNSELPGMLLSCDQLTPEQREVVSEYC